MLEKGPWSMLLRASNEAVRGAKARNTAASAVTVMAVARDQGTSLGDWMPGAEPENSEAKHSNGNSVRSMGYEG